MVLLGFRAISHLTFDLSLLSYLLLFIALFNGPLSGHRAHSGLFYC